VVRRYISALDSADTGFEDPTLHLNKSLIRYDMRNTLTLVFGLFVALTTSNAFAQLSYDESTDGDLSGAFGAPTQLVFGIGLNTITGDIGSMNSSGATNGTDADYFWFTLGAGETVDSIVTTRDNTSTTQSFIGYVAGTAFGGQTAGDLDANTLFDNETLLPGGLLSAPLTAGNHAFWVQETGGAVDYSITFNVTSAVPEPSSAIALIGLGLAGLIRRRR